VRAVLRGIRRTIGSAPQGKAPAATDVLKQMLVLCPDALAGKRIRALLAPGLPGGFPRSANRDRFGEPLAGFRPRT
jgi:hypothetical protein